MSQCRKQVINRTSLPGARQLAEKQESQIQIEIDAFEDFLDRLEEIPPHPYRADGGSLHGTVQSRSKSSHTFQGAVQTAYCETVLSVSHWKEEYDEESTLESIKNEFGPEIATGLTGGSATWSPLLWNQIQSASKAAIETRQQSLPVLVAERQQLENLQSSLADIDDEFAAIERREYSFAERSDRLTTIQQQLEELTRDQQTYLSQRKTSDETLFPSYIYADLDTDYPGLAALATSCQILDRIELRHWAGFN